MSVSLPEDAPIPALEALSVVIDYGRAARARDKQVEATKKTSLAAAGGMGSASLPAAAVSHPTDRRQNHSVAELEGLQLRYQPTWLLTMIGGAEAMDSYCQVKVKMGQRLLMGPIHSWRVELSAGIRVPNDPLELPMRNEWNE